jgi:hypothetical protein
MWGLYRQYEDEFANSSAFFPLGDLSMMTQSGNAPRKKEYELLHAMIESVAITSSNTTKRRYSLIQPQPGQCLVDEEVLSIAWNHLPAK